MILHATTRPARRARATGRAVSLPRRAYTLLELLIVLSIAGVMAAIAVPRFSRAGARYRIDAACARIVADLDNARTHARSSSAKAALAFATSADGYTWQLSSSVLNAGDRVDLSRPPYGVTVLNPSFGSDRTVIFDAWGRPDSGGTVTIAAGSSARDITLDANTGKASIGQLYQLAQPAPDPVSPIYSLLTPIIEGLK